MLNCVEFLTEVLGCLINTGLGQTYGQKKEGRDFGYLNLSFSLRLSSWSFGDRMSSTQSRRNGFFYTNYMSK